MKLQRQMTAKKYRMTEEIKDKALKGCLALSITPFIALIPTAVVMNILNSEGFTAMYKVCFLVCFAITFNKLNK